MTNIHLSPFFDLKAKILDNEHGLLYRDYVHHHEFFIVGTELIHALAHARIPQNPLDLAQQFAQVLDESLEDCQDLIQELLEAKILLSAEDKQAQAAQDFLESWQAVGWSKAAIFHLASRDIEFKDYGTEDAIVEEQSEMQKRIDIGYPPPPIYKSYPDARTIPLPTAQEDRVSLAAFLGIEQPLTKALDLDHLSTLLFYTFGKMGTKRTYSGNYLLRTSPSGGSRHPTEAYVLIQAIAGLDAGIYHYNVQHHRLELIAGALDEACLQLLGKNTALIIGTARVQRSMWRYRTSRSLRVVYTDAGHLMETFRGVARACGLAVANVPMLDYALAEQVLCLNPIEEPSIFALALPPLIET